MNTSTQESLSKYQAEQKKFINEYAKDSDGDGFADNLEKAEGTDPLKATSNQDTKDKEQQKTLTEIIKAKDTEALTQHLKDGIKEYFDSDRYKDYLKAMSQFNNYSPRNIQLIASQKPDASLVQSFNQWKKAEGKVNKGEKAIYIMAPNPYIKKDKDSNIVKDENGDPITISSFKPVPVFDVSQQTGAKIASMTKEVTTPLTQEEYRNIYRTLKEISEENNIPVYFKEIEGRAGGYFDPDKNEIVIKKGTTHPAEIVGTLIHEMAHSEIHHKEAEQKGLTKSTKELQAESVAYVVSNHLGINMGEERSFAYLTSWSNDKDGLTDLTAQLEIVQKKASSLMERIDQRLEKYQVKDTYKTEEKTENPKNNFYRRIEETNKGQKEKTKKSEKPSKTMGHTI